MAVVLLYHDVVNRGEEGLSGFPGAIAARYKLSQADFRAHLDAIAAANRRPPVAPAAPRGNDLAGAPLLLTFDDGGLTAFTRIADAKLRRSIVDLVEQIASREATPEKR